jgi:hypothetical protein
MTYKPFKLVLISENLDVQVAIVSGKMLSDTEPNVHTVQRRLAVCGEKFLGVVGVDRELTQKFDIREVAKLSPADLERFLDGQFIDFTVQIYNAEKSWVIPGSLYITGAND